MTTSPAPPSGCRNVETTFPCWYHLSPDPTSPNIFSEINSGIANYLKAIGMMKMHYVTIYLNIYECVSDYMKIYHDCFWTVYGHFANEARYLSNNKIKWGQFPRNTQKVQNTILMTTINVPIDFRMFAIAQLSPSYTIGKYSAKWGPGLNTHAKWIMIEPPWISSVFQTFRQSCFSRFI